MQRIELLGDDCQPAVNMGSTVAEPTAVEEVDLVNIPPTDDPLEVLKAVMNNPRLDVKIRMRAAVTMAQYTNIKKADGGKKDARNDAACELVLTSKFAPQPPPRLAIVARQ